MEDSASHLRKLVDQVLDLARLAAGRMELHREPVEVRDLLLGVATEMEPLAAERGLALTLSVGPALPRLETDPTQVRQVIVNLVGNAIKFTPQGGIQLRARQATAVGVPGPGAWVEVQVADSGIGIAPADQARVFDEFEQVNPGARGASESRGVGLGLPISRRLARHLGGDVTLASVPGEGSVFSLWLPVVAPAP